MNFIQSIKTFILGVAAGIIICVIVGSFIYIKNTSHLSASTITTKQIVGEKIEHSKWNFAGDNISFETEAQGAGAVYTDIPKVFIPEVNAYLNRTDIVQMDIVFLNSAGKFKTLISPSYFHRWRDLAIGGGPVFSTKVLADKIYGAKMSVQYGF